MRSISLAFSIPFPSLAPPLPLTPLSPSDIYNDSRRQGLAFSPVDANQLVYCSGYEVLALDLRLDPPQRRPFVGELVVALLHLWIPTIVIHIKHYF